MNFEDGDPENPEMIVEVPEDWGLELHLDPETRVWTMEAKGPACLLKLFLVEMEDNVMQQLNTESTFDEIITESW